jgi:hypothetical protein
MKKENKVQVKLPTTGSWRWVIEDLGNDLRYSIYPTNALESIGDLPERFPNLEFRMG